MALGLATLLGSYLTKILLGKKVPQYSLMWVAALLLTMGAVGVYTLLNTIWFVLPMMLVVMAFAMAIPNVLSMALVDYKQQTGSAGALFGLLYYLLIGTGLAFSGAVQHLGAVLIACAAVTVLVTLLSRE